MAKATVLTYTDKEIEAIEILKANAGEKKTAAELGISTAILTSLQKKMDKVASGELANPENLEVINIQKEDVEREVTLTKVYKAYFI